MIEPTSTTLAQAAVWQTGTALVQAVCSVSLLTWYVLAAHLDRQRVRQEKAEDFDSLVRLCRDLGTEAKDRTATHREALINLSAPAVGASDPRQQFALWRADMHVIYVCLNEVPHYEVRNPAFSTALTRLWLAVDARSTDEYGVHDADGLIQFLSEKFDRICREVDAMALLLNCKEDRVERSRQLIVSAGRRGKLYEPIEVLSHSPKGRPSGE